MDKYIRDFKEGDRLVSIPLLVTNVTKGVSSSSLPYANVSLQDYTGTIEAKKWDLQETDLLILEPGKVVSISGDVIFYRESLQIKINYIEELDQDKIDVLRYCLPSPVPQEELIKKLNKYLASIKDQDVKRITDYLITKYYDRYITYPAATKNHHEFASGLLYHSLSMVDLVLMISSMYGDLDEDILIAGCLLHDLGKVIELSGPIATKYTLEGRLLGHISIMVSEIQCAVRELNITSEVGLLLEHMVLSHHGEKDFGSPVPPLTKEAEVLHLVDNLDSKMQIMEKNLALVNEGEFSSRILALEGRALYKPKKR